VLPIDLDAPIRAVPIWLLRAYLVEAGGREQPDGSVAGDGWRATLTPAEDFRIGSLRVGQVRLELTGDEAALAAVRPLIARKLGTRAGG
jgi:hypothetical protein